MKSETHEFVCTIADIKYEKNNFKVYNFSTNHEVPGAVRGSGVNKNLFFSTFSCFENFDQGLTLKIRIYCEPKPKETGNGFWMNWRLLDFKQILDSKTEQQYLATLVSPKRCEAILSVYPDFVERLRNDKPIDISKIPGIAEKSFKEIRFKVLNGYWKADLLAWLRPIGITERHITKLLGKYRNPIELKKKLVENPYMFTIIKGFGFISVDKMVLKMFPEKINSEYRLEAFIEDYMKSAGNVNGDTVHSVKNIKKLCQESVKEAAVHFDNHLLKKPNYLFQKGDLIGLSMYYNQERYIYDKLEDMEKKVVPWKQHNSNYVIQTEKELGYLLSEEQKEAIEAIWKHNVIFLIGSAGVGKEQPVDSKVYTPKGPVRIGDLKIGDKVFSSNGSITKVNGVFPQGIRQAYKINFRDNSYAECGENHLWNVWTKKLRSNKRPCRTMSLKEIIDSGLMVNKRNYKYSIPLCDPIKYSKKKLPIDPYLMGVLLGDGSLHESSLVLTIGDKDSLIINEVQQRIPKEIKLTYKQKKGCKAYTFARNNKEYRNTLITELTKMNLRVKSIDKFIPDIYKYSSIEHRLELLKGLMDTDGYIANNRTRFFTSSLRLRDDIIELVQSLGGTAIKLKDDVRSKNTNYSINVKMFMNPFKLKRKSSKWMFSKKNPPSRYITSIEKSRVCEQVCISVDSEDGLYLTDGYIVTHNTTVIKGMVNALKSYSIGMCSLSAKASVRMSEVAGSEAFTYHRFLGWNGKKFEYNKENLLYHDVIISDETSMANLFIMKSLLEAVKIGKKIIFVGDDAQLPPIGAGAFFKDMLESDFKICRLTKIYRQAQKSGIIIDANFIRQKINPLSQMSDLFDKKDER